VKPINYKYRRKFWSKITTVRYPFRKLTFNRKRLNVGVRTSFSLKSFKKKTSAGDWLMTMLLVSRQNSKTPPEEMAKGFLILAGIVIALIIFGSLI